MTQNWPFAKNTDIFQKQMRSVIVSQNHYLNKILDVHPLRRSPLSYCRHWKRVNYSSLVPIVLWVKPHFSLVLTYNCTAEYWTVQCTALYCNVQYITARQYIAQYCTVQRTILYCTVKCTTECSTEQYTAQYCTVQHTILYCTVQCTT